MRKEMVFILASVFVFATSDFAFAQSTNVSGENDQTQGQEQQFIYAPVSKDNTSVCGFVNPAGGHPRTGLLYIPSDQDGRQINNLGSSTIADIFQMYTSDGYDVFVQMCDEINGKGYFKRVSKNIRRIPAIVKKGGNDVNEVYLIDDFNAAKIRMRKGIEIYGTIAYDPKLDKKYAVNREQVYVFAGQDARSLVNANVMIPLLDAYRNQFRAGSFGADLLGVISKLVTVGNPYGFGFGGGADVTAGRQTMYGESGTTIAFLYVEPQLLASLMQDPSEVIARRLVEREQDLAECTTIGANNAKLHTEQADDNVELFRMSKEDDRRRLSYLNNARFHYRRALKNGLGDLEEVRVWKMLSSVYTELWLASGKERACKDHATNAEKFAKKAGLIEAHRL
ncbi:MAG: hypothetical protein U9O20_03940 [Patescibacteria group bacterium]|nr:hypothetical protein [Patescibacteria group bacterium]